jgi:phage tail sheath gpL-like
VAKAFEYLINNGSTGVWAARSGTVLTIQARVLGTAGNNLTLAATPSTGTMRAVAGSATFSAGVDGVWLTDLTVVPRLNRAVRDWHRAYYTALQGYGIEVAAAWN